MVVTTFKQLRRIDACAPRYQHLAKVLGGIKRYGQDTPITLKQVFDIGGALDALWLLDRLFRLSLLKCPAHIQNVKRVWEWMEQTKG